MIVELANEQLNMLTLRLNLLNNNSNWIGPPETEMKLRIAQFETMVVVAVVQAGRESFELQLLEVELSMIVSNVNIILIPSNLASSGNQKLKKVEIGMSSKLVGWLITKAAINRACTIISSIGIKQHRSSRTCLGSAGKRTCKNNWIFVLHDFCFMFSLFGNVFLLYLGILANLSAKVQPFYLANEAIVLLSSE